MDSIASPLTAKHSFEANLKWKYRNLPTNSQQRENLKDWAWTYNRVWREPIQPRSKAEISKSSPVTHTFLLTDVSLLLPFKSFYIFDPNKRPPLW